MVIFRCYVHLPEGKSPFSLQKNAMVPALLRSPPPGIPPIAGSLTHLEGRRPGGNGQEWENNRELLGFIWFYDGFMHAGQPWQLVLNHKAAMPSRFGVSSCAGGCANLL